MCRLKLAVVVLAGLLTCSFARAVADDLCPVGANIVQQDECNRNEAPTRGAACPRSVLLVESALVFSERLHVNTDGNLRSYSQVDPNGDRCGSFPAEGDPVAGQCAMNTVCNGVVIRVPRADGGTRLMSGVGRGNCSPLLAAFREIRDAGWLPADGRRVIWGDVIAAQDTQGDARYRPCVSPEGFLISMASAMSGLARRNQCDQAQWLDADVPSVVAPRCWRLSYREAHADACRTAVVGLPSDLDVRPGDLATVRAPGPNGRLIHALVGDNGPNNKLGEASVGLHWRLRGRAGLPRTTAQSNSLDGEQPFEVVIFPGTRIAGLNITPADYATVEAASRRRFESWNRAASQGGGDRLGACTQRTRRPA